MGLRKREIMAWYFQQYKNFALHARVYLFSFLLAVCTRAVIGTMEKSNRMDRHFKSSQF